MGIIKDTILNKGKDVLNVYFTAGFPILESTTQIIKQLEYMGADIIELGMPYSDPLADGPTIQKSSEIALRNGQNIHTLFKQVTEARKETDIPIIMMGYYNQMLQYGEEKFINDASKAGINGMILPDLPMEVYERLYKSMFDDYNMEISFLITPLTTEDRIRKADTLSTAFLYVVSQSSITGTQGSFTDKQIQYFQRIQDMNLFSPKLIGFGIHDAETRKIASQYAEGVIIGSAFIRALGGEGDLNQKIESFMQSLRY